MALSLSTLKEDVVFKHFINLTEIPRESGNEKAVSDYCVAFAKTLGLDVLQDEANNVIIRKPATPGYEDHPTVILQGHLDMVCVKEDGLDFDFKTQAIPLKLEGNLLKTEGTTLGADNGIAVAMIMSVLEAEDLVHPPIEALFTTEEETGMGGVLALDEAKLSGKVLINIDAEEEGVVFTSCAGGVNNILTFPTEYHQPKKQKAFMIEIQGLKGGHSGMEIHQHRANALKLLGRTLNVLAKVMPFELAHVAGGEKMNAIAKYAKAVIVIDDNYVKALKEEIERLNTMFIDEHLGSDTGILLSVKAVDLPERVLTTGIIERLITCLVLMPFGVQTMSSTIEGLVESSSNLGILSMDENKIELTNSVRSSVASLKEEISNRVGVIATASCAKWHQISDYPAWTFKPESPVRDLMQKLYLEMYQEPLKVAAIHAGLECGFFSEKLGDIDMIAMGPNMYDVHTPKERVEIDSVKRVYTFLLKVLSEL